MAASPAPTREVGAEQQSFRGLNGWSSFIDDAEFVPELAWPRSVDTYQRMRSDSQVEALHLGTTQPVREFRWSINPNGCPASLVERAAMDLGLPIMGHEDDNVPRSALTFDFDAFLADALIAPLFGFFHFEIVGENLPDEWRLLKLAPRHPRTVAELQVSAQGDLLAIRQNISGDKPPNGMFGGLPPWIYAPRLLAFVWRAEGGSQIGRSMLRSIYREWLVKDRTIRIAAINLERAGGVPVIEGPQGAADSKLADLAVMARQFKVAEGGGGAIPFGSKLHLVGANAPSAIELLKYCDEAMARVWALMLVQLGTTQTGNRALGQEFANYAGRAQRALAGWICGIFNRLLDDYVEWNLGSSATHAPRLAFESSKPEALSVADFVALIEAGALTVDPELESWMRNEHNLPVKPAGLPAAGDPAATPAPPPQLPPGPPQSTGVTAAGRRLFRREIRAGLQIPGRELRRQPYEQEIRAAVDFPAIDLAHQQAYERAEALFLQRVIPGQIQALASQITTTKAGTDRKRLTRQAMASLSASPLEQEELQAVLAAAARGGAVAAQRELAEQGVLSSAPSDDALAAAVGDQAQALGQMAANGLSLAAQRRATSLVGTGRTISAVASDVSSHLGDMKHQWTLDQLRGAVTAAQNAGRVKVFEAAEGGSRIERFYASEILDANCCTPCTDIDGTEYVSLSDASQDYPGGGFVDCAGGPRCRGTLIAVYYEQDPASASNPVVSDASVIG